MPDNACLADRNRQLARLASDLPGCKPYDNVRPINVPGRFDGQTILAVMTNSHPHISEDEWKEIFNAGRIRKEQVPVRPSRVVRGGEQLTHVFPDTIEPKVNAAIKVIFEDEALVAVNKPAPLPMHPSGRFNHNTLTTLLDRVFEQPLRPVHRLDANTSGVVLFAKTSQVATAIREQFEQSNVQKLYLVRCIGVPSEDSFTCNDPIGKATGPAGLRTLDDLGQRALTEFECVQRLANDYALLHARPKTGRTNQIRIHLWGQRIPIAGDPLYLPHLEMGRSQTLGIDDPPMCLHAQGLKIFHPLSAKEQVFETDAPNWWTKP